MTPSIEQVERQLERGAFSLAELLSLRRALRAPFRQHPLGFLACRLLTEGPRNLRLHFWPLSGGAQQHPHCQIHDHLFEFKSWVLAGTLENVEYGLSSKGQEFAIYRAEYAGHRSSLVKTGGVQRLSELSRYTLEAGTSYSVQAGVLHETIRVGTAPAFTVLATNDVSAEAPLVLCPLDGPERYTYERHVVEESVVETLLAEAYPSLHRKCYSGLRPLPHSGELKR